MNNQNIDFYKKKYFKYKNKYISLKNFIGGRCTNKIEDNYKITLNNKESEIYVGITDISNKLPIDSPCDSEIFNKLYIESKTYLGSLSNFQNLILWYYTGGTLAKLINNYNLKRYTIDDLFIGDSRFLKILYESLLKTFLELLAYKNKFKIEFDNTFAEIYNEFNKILIDNFEKVLLDYRKILRDKKKDNKLNEVDYKKFLSFNDDFEKIKSNLKGSTYENKIIVLHEISTKIFNNLYLYEFFLTAINILFIEKKLSNKIALKLIIEYNNQINNIVKNAPRTKECIILYKTIEKYDKIPDIDKPWKQEVINSMTCSRKTNIGIFISKNSTCCLLEVQCDIGVPVLFLDYDKTMYGKQMFEVILPINILFTILSKEIKPILTYEYKETESKIQTMTQSLHLSYDKPYIKNIDTYFIRATYNE